VLAFAVDGRIAQRDTLDTMPGAVETAQAFANQLGAGIESADETVDSARAFGRNGLKA
jgi:hypothetical protein